MNETPKVRKNYQVTWSVWRALFIRETLQRTMTSRLSWFWMLMQPTAQILMFIGVREIIGKFNLIAGADYIPWLVVGMMVFMLISEGVVRSLGAIDASKGLLSYRQVQPIDTIIIRIATEGSIKAVVLFVLIAIFEILGIKLVPADPLAVIAIWIAAWIFGLAAGILLSIITNLLPSLTTIVRISMMPLYLLSGVMIPINYLSESIKQALLFNPILHLVESMRAAWLEDYQNIPGTDIAYSLTWAMSLLFLGLLIYNRFKERLAAQ